MIPVQTIPVLLGNCSVDCTRTCAYNTLQVQNLRAPGSRLRVQLGGGPANRRGQATPRRTARPLPHQRSPRTRHWRQVTRYKVVASCSTVLRTAMLMCNIPIAVVLLILFERSLLWRGIFPFNLNYFFY